MRQTRAEKSAKQNARRAAARLGATPGRIGRPAGHATDGRVRRLDIFGDEIGARYAPPPTTPTPFFRNDGDDVPLACRSTTTFEWRT